MQRAKENNLGKNYWRSKPQKRLEESMDSPRQAVWQKQKN